MKDQALTQLKDLHLPTQIGAWPLAYGWYILIFLILFFFFTSVIYIYKYCKYKKPKRLALKKLAALELVYQKENNANQMAYQLTMLLKQVSFAYFPRVKIASLHDKDWQNFLGNKDWSKTLTRLNYQKNINEDISSLFKPIKYWIKNCDKQITLVTG